MIFAAEDPKISRSSDPGKFKCSKIRRVQGFDDLAIQRFEASMITKARKFKDSRIAGLKDLKIQKIEGSEIHKFKNSEIR